MAETFLESVRDVVRNTFCNALSVADGFGDWLNEGSTPGSIFSLGDDIGRAQINGLQGMFCNRQPGTPPELSPEPEFEGGQCTFGYRVNLEIITESGTQLTDFRHPDGPILGTTIEDIGGGFADIILDAPNDANIFRVGIDRRNGSPNKYISHSITSVVPKEANDVDNCGDPPTPPGFDPPPGTTGPIDDDIVFGPPGTEVTIPVGIVYAPVNVDVNGNLNIPFSINNPNFNINGNIALTNGDINFNFGGGKKGNESCCLPPGVDDDDTPPEGPEEEDETAQTIVGVLVNSVIDDSAIRSTLVGQQNGPDFYNPRVGNIYFLLRVEGQIFWTEPIKVQHENQYIECPVDFGAIRVVGNPVEGVSMRLSPIRRTIPVDEFPE